MSLPRFFSRVNDSIGPLLAAETITDVRAILDRKSVFLRTPADLDKHQLHLAGFLLLVNLCARLYPRIGIVASETVMSEARRLAMRINPLCEIGALDPDFDDLDWTGVSWCTPGREGSIIVAPDGWEVLVDLPGSRLVSETNMLVALAAGAIAAGALFRSAFAEFLPNGRTTAEPGRMNVLTLGPTAESPPPLQPDVPMGRVHLVGAGAVGQAAVYALARISATGSITVVDPETISLSNMQRYVLAFDDDEGLSKCLIVERELRGTRLEVTPVEAPWSLDLLESGSAQVICSAVDSDEVRVALQAGLPQRIYNAWTQPADIGWSRHESFGVEPCLACLYWPDRPRPSHHELVARAIRQHELRSLAYLVHRLPVDAKLAAAQIPILPDRPVPAESATWTERSLLDDVAAALEISPADTVRWNGRTLQELYRDGICGGALMKRQVSDVPVEVAVPLAHQSALAGIMLAIQMVVAARPDLSAFRSIATEGRLDLLSPLPQIAARPRQRTHGCICSDTDFVARYRAKWPWAAPMPLEHRDPEVPAH